MCLALHQHTLDMYMYIHAHIIAKMIKRTHVQFFFWERTIQTVQPCTCRPIYIMYYAQCTCTYICTDLHIYIQDVYSRTMYVMHTIDDTSKCKGIYYRLQCYLMAPCRHFSDSGTEVIFSWYTHYVHYHTLMNIVHAHTCKNALGRRGYVIAIHTCTTMNNILGIRSE